MRLDMQLRSAPSDSAPLRPKTLGIMLLLTLAAGVAGTCLTRLVEDSVTPRWPVPAPRCFSLPLFSSE
jgi:hypothetical protein